MAASTPMRLVLSPREQQLLTTFLRDHFSDKIRKPDEYDSQSAQRDNFNLASFRAASRVYAATSLSLKLVASTLNAVSLRTQRKSGRPVQLRKPIVASPSRFALSLASLLFFHRTLYRLFSKLRLQLLHEKVQNIRERWPKLYAILTSKLTPAIGASLSGLSFGICPSDQPRVTIAIYVGWRALEVLYDVLSARGLTRNNPFGHWAIFALAQGQLLHAFVFDRDCFPEAYSNLILANTPEYVQRRPTNLSPKVAWPTTNQIVDSIAEMARLNWPPFISPILRPNAKSPSSTLPPSINPIINPITSRAHPSLTNLSCALIHPSQTSCFIAYLRQTLLSFPSLLRFFTIYYGALSVVMSPQKFLPAQNNLLPQLNKLSQQIFRTTTALTGAIGVSWASICLFQQIFPRKFLPQFRFVLGGFLGGLFQIVEGNSSAGYANSMYAARTSVDSLWKVGVKRGWWRGVKGGDVYVLVAAMAVLNVCWDVGGERLRREQRMLRVLKVLRGEVELGLGEKKVKKESVPGESEAVVGMEKQD
ncbi:uncharacterized protein AB675_6956 [Cyphellophora attinorum]|uniref:Transmembrane protein n=1 Tax=Cyphellophora attinorum TaxID=1664694 RepID=A0A0N1HUQ3_9EURO|nr:uncharacterized protein AB675_6956 [Phialophora attinorum]KPI43185.1 hypothetical protein AB675_6956 [Phialophora attinorum]